VAAVGVIAVVVAWPQIRPRLLRSDQSTRWFHLIASAQMISERPLLGWGTGSFLSRHPHFRPVEAGRHGRLDQISQHPHNEYLAVAIRIGLLGFVFYGGGLYLALRRALRRRNENRWIVPLAAGAVGMLVHGLFTVSLSFWGAAAMFWTLIGVLLALGRPQPAAAPARQRGGAAGALIFALCAVVIGVLWWEFAWQGLLAENRLLAARRADADHDPRAAAQVYDDAIRRARYVPDYVRPHLELGLTLAQAGEMPRAVLAFERARLLAPDLGRTDLLLGAGWKQLANAAPPGSSCAHRCRERSAALYNAFVTVRPYSGGADARLRLVDALLKLSPDYLPEAIRQLEAAALLEPENPEVRRRLDRYRALRSPAGKSPL
jgi:hypothetical protein